MKRLRSRYPQTIRYFMCGEYGENFSRPHYHACLFGLSFTDREPIQEREGVILYNSPLLDEIWGHGYCSIGDVNFETAAYTARYVHKKVMGQQREQHYQRTCPTTMNQVAIEHEYVSMSLKPGIGADWSDKYKSDLYPSDYVIHKGQKIKIPRYYDKLYELNGDDIETIKIQRKKNARQFLENNTPERLAVREQIKQLSFKRLKRSYENHDT